MSIDFFVSSFLIGVSVSLYNCYCFESYYCLRLIFPHMISMGDGVIPLLVYLSDEQQQWKHSPFRGHFALWERKVVAPAQVSLSYMLAL